MKSGNSLFAFAMKYVRGKKGRENRRFASELPGFHDFYGSVLERQVFSFEHVFFASLDDAVSAREAMDDFGIRCGDVIVEYLIAENGHPVAVGKAAVRQEALEV